jgi:hypothetical protein
MKTEQNKNQIIGFVATRLLLLITLGITVRVVIAATCFQEAWPVTYRPIPACDSAESTAACYKYIMNDPGYGFDSCRDVADGAKACEYVDTTITFDEEEGRCSNGNCANLVPLHNDVPRTGSFPHDTACYGG